MTELIGHSMQLKGKKGGLDFSDNFIHENMQLLSDFEVQPSPQARRVSRRTLSNVFGGQLMGLRIKLHRNMDWRPSGTHKAVFALRKLNPFLPEKPGKAGLLFGCRSELISRGTQAVFVHNMDKPETWTYMGEYRFSFGTQIGPRDFARQSNAVCRF